MTVFLGTSGNDEFYVPPINAPVYPPGDVIDGGFGYDTLSGSGNLSGLTLHSIEALSFPSLTLSADEVAHGLASDLAVSAREFFHGQNLLFQGTVTILGSPGAPVDVSGWN